MAFDPNDEVSVTLKVRHWNLVLRLLRDLVEDPQTVITTITTTAQAEEVRRNKALAKVQIVPAEPPSEAPVNLAEAKVRRPARGAAAPSEQS